MMTTDPHPYSYDYWTDRPPTNYAFFSWWVLVISALTLAAFGGFFAAIWALATPDDPFWPAWPIVIMASMFFLHTGLTASVRGVRSVAKHGIRARRVGASLIGLECHVASTGALLLALWGFWALTDADMWPIWPSLVFGMFVVIHAGVALGLRSSTGFRERLAQVESSRTGVVEAQELELRRIERDLHDGAQARLVALNMQLGLATQRLEGNDPEAARGLIEEARESTRTALRELRDLARGIYPPVLADRGLLPALESLAAATPLDVRIVGGGVTERLPAATEGALYFVAAEALANVGKHAPDAANVQIHLRRGEFDVVLTFQDTGPGGADPEGSGLTGIRQRVEALDGRLTITSPPGGPTTIRAELPCAQ